MHVVIYFSSIVTTRSTGGFSTTCLVPLGHVIVSLSIFAAGPKSEVNARIVLATDSPSRRRARAAAVGPPAVTSTCAPMPSRLLLCPTS